MSPSERRERKYMLTKIDKGDYLLPSNDGLTIWRLTVYRDGQAHGVEGMSRDLEFWGVWKWVGTGGATIDPDDPASWDMWDGSLPTRAEAIKAALR